MPRKNFDSDRLEKEIENFEKAVDFEFVPMVAEKSSYTAHVFLISFFFTYLIGYGLFEIAVYFLKSHLTDISTFHMMGLLVIFILSAFLSRSLSQFPSVQRFFIPSSERSRQVHEKAQLMFFKRGLHEIKSHNALLVYISMMEKMIVILPDDRAQIAQIQHLSEQSLKTLQSHFQNQKFEEGLVAVVKYLKGELEKTNPRTEVESNQYCNKVIWL